MPAIAVHPELVGSDYATSVWISQAARLGLGRLDNSVSDALQDKLVYCAENGFRLYEKNGVVVHEGDGIYRFGIKLSLFRWWGFYHGFQWSEFIILDWTLKRKQKRGKTGDDMVRKLAKIRENGAWYKANT